jgi:hypothetical protein
VYRVEIKRSARRANAAVGEAVHREGSARAFEDRAAADAWAAGLADGDATVWVQDAPPHDRSAADGYLVARRVRSTTRPTRSPADGCQAAVGDRSGGRG